MPLVVIEAPGAPEVRVDAPEGGPLGDLCDDVGAPIPFSCRSANCGTCRVVVLAGEAEHTPPDDEELDVLDVFDSPPPRFRLACCAKLRAGGGTLHLRPVRDDE
jgi:ferredoxin